ncbi:hypothetical protein MSC49_41090 (plasmid) [Methylosinus sp. C49]|uniref:hypothetical protein n=1 Tax=Methylosinus sp. C49 TaxID=2699395 RepID=UPI0013675EEA|nr:hypothetical protein [Methylosinus sp. C49]BBU64174.1 hypothetical protein MSC49_41090 [Methylosinus sp. C49]
MGLPIARSCEEGKVSFVGAVWRYAVPRLIGVLTGAAICLSSTPTYSFHDTGYWGAEKIKVHDIPTNVERQMAFLFNTIDIEEIELYYDEIETTNTKIYIYRPRGKFVCTDSKCPYIININTIDNDIFATVWCDSIINIKEELRHDRKGRLFRLIKFRDGGRVIFVSIFGSGMINFF